MSEVFRPPFYLRSASIQTLLGGSSMRKWGAHRMAAAASEVILTPFEGVRLQGFYSGQPDRPSRGLVVLLHGWEGSADSAYILSTSKFLYRNGYPIFRLNYRDHGDSHHLNPGLFLATLLDEVFAAVQQVSEYEKDLPLYLVGFSMGGNFALRIARKCVESPISNLSHVVSISPVLDPQKSTDAIDHVIPIQRYFLRKWRRSLQKKQACFPERYDFGQVLACDSIAAMTDLLIAYYSEYETASDYFSNYAILNGALEGISVATTIIAAQDDPIIPVEDFFNLKLNSRTKLFLHRYGGHNGFLESLLGRAWYEQKMLEDFAPK